MTHWEHILHYESEYYLPLLKDVGPIYGVWKKFYSNEVKGYWPSVTGFFLFVAGFITMSNKINGVIITNTLWNIISINTAEEVVKQKQLLVISNETCVNVVYACFWQRCHACTANLLLAFSSQCAKAMYMYLYTYSYTCIYLCICTIFLRNMRPP